MTVGVTVKGGTAAGRRRVRQPHRWAHYCPRDRVGAPVVLTSYSCPDCGTRRPPKENR